MKRFLILATMYFCCIAGAAAQLVIPEATGNYGRIQVIASKVCTKGKACGDTCININYTCHTPTYPTYPTTPTTPTTPPVPTVPVIPDVAVKPSPTQCSTATVLRIVDGDTLVVATAAGTEKVRIGQIDAPESSQPFGRQATSCLASLVANQTVRMCSDGRDRYGRTVANIAVNGTDVGESMVAQGCAWAYSKYLEAGSSLPTLEYQAQVSGRGLWAGQAVAPWVYRGGSAPVALTASGTLPVTVTTTTTAARVDRVLDWAESAFSEVLQAGTGTLSLSNGAYRCYGGGICLGVIDGKTMVYDGVNLSDVGPDTQFLQQAEAQGY